MDQQHYFGNIRFTVIVGPSCFVLCVQVTMKEIAKKPSPFHCRLAIKNSFCSTTDGTKLNKKF